MIFFDHTVRGALAFPYASRATGFASQDHAQARYSNAAHAAHGNTCAWQHLGYGGHFGQPVKEGVPGLQRGPEVKPPHPTYSISRSDCHLPATGTADRWLRLVAQVCLNVANGHRQPWKLRCVHSIYDTRKTDLKRKGKSVFKAETNAQSRY